MLCPLRKMIKSADFDKCYGEKCEWWCDSTHYIDSCAIKIIALHLGGDNGMYPIGHPNPPPIDYYDKGKGE